MLAAATGRLSFLEPATLIPASRRPPRLLARFAVAGTTPFPLEDFLAAALALAFAPPLPFAAGIVLRIRSKPAWSWGTRDVRKRCERGSGGVALASSRGSEDVRDALQYSEVHKNRVRWRARGAHVFATSATRASSARKVPSGKSQQTGAKEIPFRGSPGFTCLRPLPTNCERVVPAPERV